MAERSSIYTFYKETIAFWKLTDDIIAIENSIAHNQNSKWPLPECKLKMVRSDSQQRAIQTYFNSISW